MFKRLLKIFKPRLTTLRRYKIMFITLDGKEHEFNHLNFIDDNAILCSVGEYFLMGKDFLQDDKNNIYPIGNIQTIRFDLIDTIENVIVKYISGSIRRAWYLKDMIKTYSEET